MCSLDVITLLFFYPSSFANSDHKTNSERTRKAGLLQMRLCQIWATVHSPLSSDHGCSNDMTPKKNASETRVIQHFEDQWNQNQPPLYRQLQSNFGCQPNFFQVGILVLSATAGRDYHSWWKSHLTLPTLRSVWIKVMLRPKALRESLQFPADTEGSMTRKCHLTVQLLIHDQIYQFAQIAMMISEECAGISLQITIFLAIHGIDRGFSVW